MRGALAFVLAAISPMAADLALNDNFLVVVQELVVDKGGDPAKLAEINRLIDEMRASGFIKASLDRAKLSGVDVAPAKR